MLKFYADIKKYSPLVVGHFIELDYHMVNVELFRIGKADVFKKSAFFLHHESKCRLYYQFSNQSPKIG